MSKSQMQGALKLIELALLYIEDCEGSCEDCPLHAEPKRKADELPDIPPGITLCDLFDYIACNSYRQDRKLPKVTESEGGSHGYMSVQRRG